MSNLRPSDLLRVALLTLAAAIVIGVAALGKTAVAPPKCANCHSSRTFASGTAASAHSDVACARCHMPADGASRAAFASRVLFGMQLKLTEGDRSGAHVVDGTCLSCHQDVRKRVVASKGKRIDHATCAEGRRCTDCHSAVAHGEGVRWRRSAQMSDCLQCHATDEVRRSCDTCHDNRTPRERLAAGAWQTTHGENWRRTHGMGDLKTCAACHPKDYCSRCHGVNLPHGETFVLKHGTEAVQSPSKCASCHDKKQFCDSCHGTPMPHAPAFTKKHSGIAETKTNPKCLRCHVQDDCTGCHTKHVHPGGSKAATASVTAVVPR